MTHEDPESGNILPEEIPATDDAPHLIEDIHPQEELRAIIRKAVEATCPDMVARCWRIRRSAFLGELRRLEMQLDYDISRVEEALERERRIRERYG